jgi:hypothetical protein
VGAGVLCGRARRTTSDSSSGTCSTLTWLLGQCSSQKDGLHCSWSRDVYSNRTCLFGDVQGGREGQGQTVVSFKIFAQEFEWALGSLAADVA